MSNRKIFLIMLGIILAGSMLMVFACAGLMRWGGGAMADLWKARGDADAFLDLVNAGKVDEAYASAAPAFRTRTDLAQLREIVARYPVLKKQTRRTFGGMKFFSNGAGTRAHIQYTLANPNNSLSLTLVMVKSGATWKVESLNLP